MAFLVRNKLNTGKIPRIRGMGSLIEHCSCKLYLKDSPVPAIRVSGVYIPPSKTKDLDLALMMKLSDPIEAPAAGDFPPHLMAGDSNTTNWDTQNLYQAQGGGIIDHLDPDLPTYALGTSIDEILCVPGFHFPSALLPPSTLQEGG